MHDQLVWVYMLVGGLSSSITNFPPGGVSVSAESVAGICVCVSVVGAKDLAPRLPLTVCFFLVSHPRPSLINNC